MIDKENLANDIINLIDSQREGAYWDFKQQWYSKEKSSDMLHDIICMANNLENHDAYIIIGVTDDFELYGVEDDPNRKTTQNLTDFLKSKKFAGDFRPTVEVRPITVNEVLLDVICVKNNAYVPYYLTDKCKTELFPYHIYTRVQDSNTPKDKSADLIHVEILWQKRFHLFDSPLQKVTVFLSQKGNWINGVATENETSKYYKYAPKYTIKCQNLDGKAVATYTLTQIDKNASRCVISLWYHQTRLSWTYGVALDGGRYMTVRPSVGSFDCQEKHVFYYYLCKNSIQYKLYEFFTLDKGSKDYLASTQAIIQYTREVLFFEDEYALESFETHLRNNIQTYENYVQNIKSDVHRKTSLKVQGDNYQDDYDYRLALKEFYRSYQNNLKSKTIAIC